MWWDTLYKHWVISGVVKIGLDMKKSSNGCADYMIRKKNNPPEPQEQAEIFPTRVTENRNDRGNRIFCEKL